MTQNGRISPAGQLKVRRIRPLRVRWRLLKERFQRKPKEEVEPEEPVEGPEPEEIDS